jgi:uncharacterized protein
VLRDVGGGVEISVRARPRSGRPGLGPFRNGFLEVRLSAAPVEGAANAELTETLAEALGVPRRAVVLLAGQKGRIKRLCVEGLTADEVRLRLGLGDERSPAAPLATPRGPPGS